MASCRLIECILVNNNKASRTAATVFGPPAADGGEDIREAVIVVWTFRWPTAGHHEIKHHVDPAYLLNLSMEVRSIFAIKHAFVVAEEAAGLSRTAT